MMCWIGYSSNSVSANDMFHVKHLSSRLAGKGVIVEKGLRFIIGNMFGVGR